MLQLSSSAFVDGGEIPQRHTADGENQSLPLTWNGVPPEAAELALIMDDPDAPGQKPWVHWVVYNIPAGVNHLPKGIEREESIAYPCGVTQGRNSWRRDNLGYRGPAPAEGEPSHRYRLRLFALKEQLRLEPGIDKATLLKAMEDEVVSTAELTGRYGRPAK